MLSPQDSSYRIPVASAAYRLARDLGLTTEEAHRLAESAFWDLKNAGELTTPTGVQTQVEKRARDLVQAQAMDRAVERGGQPLPLSLGTAGDAPVSTAGAPLSPIQQFGQDLGAWGSENADLQARGIGRVGRFQHAERSMQAAVERPVEGQYGQTALADTLEAVAWHAVDSATFGLLRAGGWLLKELVPGIEKNLWTDTDLMKRARMTETEVGKWGAWGGELAGFFVPGGIAIKGAKAAAGALGAGKGTMQALGAAERVAEAVNVKGLFKAGHKAVDAARPSARIAKAAIEETAEKAALKAAKEVGAGELGKLSGAVRGEARRGFWESVAHRKTISPDALARGATKEIADRAEQTFRTRLYKRLTEIYGKDEQLVGTILDHAAGEFVEALGKNQVTSWAEKAVHLGKYAPAVARAIEMVTSESLGIAMHGFASRTSEALSEPELWGLDGSSDPISQFARAAWEGGVKGGTDDLTGGLRGDVIYGGILGSAALPKLLVPALGRRAHRDWVKTMAKFWGGPNDHKMIRAYGDRIGEETKHVLETMKRVGWHGLSAKEKANPLKWYKRVAPDIEKLNDHELAVLGENYIGFLKRNGHLSTSAGTAGFSPIADYNLRVLRDATADLGSKEMARGEIRAVLGDAIKKSLSQWHDVTGKGLAVDAMKNTIVGASLAVFGGGHEFYKAWKNGDVSLPNIISHIGFSFMAANDPFWNTAYSWRAVDSVHDTAWMRDRQKRLGKAEADPDELPGEMASAVARNRLVNQMVSLGMVDAPFVVYGKSKPNKIHSLSIGQGGSVAESIRRLNTSIDTRWGRTLERHGIEIVNRNTEAASRRASGESVVSQDELVEALVWLRNSAASGIEIDPWFDPDTNQKLSDDAFWRSADFADVINSPEYRSKLAVAALELRGYLIDRGYAKPGDVIHGNALSMLHQDNSEHILGKTAEAAKEAASRVLAWQTGALEPERRSGRLRPISIIGDDGSGAYNDIRRRHDRMIMTIAETGQAHLDNTPEVINLKAGGENAVKRLEALRSIHAGFEAEINQRLGTKGITLDDNDLVDFVRDTVITHQANVMPSVLVYGANRVGSSREHVVSRDTLYDAMQKIGLLHTADDAVFSAGEGTRKSGGYILIEPDYKKLNLSSERETELRNLVSVLAVQPDVRLIRDDPEVRYDSDLVEMLWDGDFQMLHGDVNAEGNREMYHNGGLFGVLDEVGLKMKNDHLARTYRESVARHVYGRVSEDAFDFYGVLDKLGFLVKRRGGVFMRLPVEFAEGREGAALSDLTPGEIGAALLKLVRGLPQEGVLARMAIDLQYMDRFAELTGELEKVGLLHGLARNDDLSDADYFTLNSEDAYNKMEVLYDSLMAYEMAQTRDIVQQVGQARGAMKLEYDRLKTVEGSEIKRDTLLRAMNNMARYVAMNSSYGWRQLVTYLRGVRVLELDAKTKKVQINVTYDEKMYANLDKVNRFLEDTMMVDNIAARFALATHSTGDAVEMAHKAYDAIYREHQDGLSVSRAMGSLGLSDQRQIASVVKATNDALPTLGTAGKTAVSEMRRILSEHVNTLVGAWVPSTADRGFEAGRMPKNVPTTLQARGLERLAGMSDVDMLGLFNAMTQRSTTRVRKHGNFIGFLEEAEVGGSRVLNVHEGSYASIRETVDVRNRGLYDEMQEAYGHEVAELDVVANYDGTPINLLLPENRDRLMEALNKEWSGLDDRHVADGRGHHLVKGGSAELAEHFVYVINGDLGRIALHKLPTGENAARFADGLGRLLAHWTPERLAQIDSREADGVIRKAATFQGLVARLANGELNAATFWEAIKDHRDDIQNAYEFIHWHHMLGAEGMTQAFHMAKTGDQLVKDVVSRVHQAFSLGNRETNPRLFREAATLAERLTSERDGERTQPYRYGEDANGNLRIMVIPDREAHRENMPEALRTAVTYVDSYSPTAGWVIDTLAAMNGYDPANTHFGGVKANLYAHGDTGVLLTKTVMAAEPELEAVMRQHGVAQIVTETAAKLMFGDLNRRGQFVLVDADGRDLRQVLAASANGRAVGLSEDAVVSVPASAIRFQQILHADVERGTVSWQTETFAGSSFIDAISEAYMQDRLVGDIMSKLQGTIGPQNIRVLNEFFTRVKEDDPTNLATLQDASFAELLMAAKPTLANPTMFGGKRSGLGWIKRRLHEDILFKGRTFAGTNAVVTPDLHGVLDSGEVMMTANMAERRVPINKIRVGVKMHSLGFDEIDRLVGEEFGLGANHHYNTAAEGMVSDFTDGRRTTWTNWSLVGKNNVVQRGLEEIARNDRPVAGVLQGLVKPLTDGTSQAANARIIGDAWTEVASAGAGTLGWQRVLSKVNAALDALHLDGPQRETALAEFRTAHDVLWAGGSSAQGVREIDVHNALAVFLGNHGGDSRLYEYGQRHYGDTSQRGLTPATYGIAHTFQRSPKVRPNDTMVAYALGFLDPRHGNAIKMSHADAVGLGEADFDKDAFNLWADMPKQAMGELMRYRNVAGVLADPKIGQMSDRAGRAAFSMFSRSHRLEDNDLYEYATHQAVAARQRGQVVKAQRIAHRMLLAQLSFAYTRKGVTYRVRPRFNSIDDLMQHGHDRIQRVNQIVQNIIDSKKGLLHRDYRTKELGGTFDPRTAVLREFFVVDEIAADGTARYRNTDLNEEQMGILKLAARPFSDALSLMQGHWEGDSAQSMEYAEMMNLAYKYNALFGDPSTSRGKLTAHIRGLMKFGDFADMDEVSKSLDFTFVNKDSMIDKLVRTLIRQDDVLDRRWETDNSLAVTLRAHLLEEVNEPFTEGQIEHFIPRFNGTMRSLDAIIKRLINEQRSGDSSARPELEARRAQMRRMLADEKDREVGVLKERKVSPGYERDAAAEATMSALALRAARNTVEDLEPGNAADRAADAQALVARRNQLYAKMFSQRAEGGAVKVEDMVTEESINAILTHEVMAYMDTHGYNGNMTAALLDLFTPQEQAYWYLKGQPVGYFKDFPVDIAHIIQRIDPTAALRLMEHVIPHRVAVEAQFAGDPGGHEMLRQQEIANKYEHIDIRRSVQGLNRARMGKHGTAMEIAQRILVAREVDDVAMREIERLTEGTDERYVPLRDRIRLKGHDADEMRLEESLERLLDPERILAERLKVVINPSVDRPAQFIYGTRGLAEVGERGTGAATAAVRRKQTPAPRWLSNLRRAEEANIKRREVQENARAKREYEEAQEGQRFKKPFKPTYSDDEQRAADAEKRAERIIGDTARAAYHNYMAEEKPLRFPDTDVLGGRSLFDTVLQNDADGAARRGCGR